MLLDYLARLHPLVIHFPIALLIVGACLEAWGWWRPTASTGGTVRLLVSTGTAAVIAAALSGWLLAEQTRRPPELRSALEWHRWLGVAAVAAAGLACVAVWQHAPSAGWRRARSLVIVGAALLVAATGHFGGLLVWGLDYFSP
ncbi:MAG TPA: DUF2231 domain-containing protein [Opitutaceae bacterium]